MNDDSWQQQIRGFLNGDSSTAKEFWDQYGPLLERVAAKHMNERLKMRVGPEDVVQSACRTFFRRAKAGQLKLDDSESLWRLLCAITLTKVREQARFHSRGKRSVDREVHAANSDDSTAGQFHIAAAGPAPEAEVIFADQFAHILGTLDEEERAIVDLKLQELTHDEIADRLGMSERTVRRVFKTIQAKLTRAFTEANPPDSPS
jgi:RNA polymerase sigma factor (sigma-70 family)